MISFSLGRGAAGALRRTPRHWRPTGWNPAEAEFSEVGQFASLRERGRRLVLGVSPECLRHRAFGGVA